MIQQIEGYVVCGCGRLELNHVAWLTNGVCWECFRTGQLARVRQVELQNRAARIRISIPSAVKRGPVRTKTTKHRADHAKRAALKRMRAVLPQVYDLFYADERVKRKLPPLPMRVDQGYLVRVVETLTQLTNYAPADTGDEASGATQGEAAGTGRSDLRAAD